MRDAESHGACRIRLSFSVSLAGRDAVKLRSRELTLCEAMEYVRQTRNE